MYRTVKTTDKPAASSGNSYCLALTHFSLFFFQAALFSNFFHYTNQTKSSLSHFFSFNLNPLWIKENVPICIHALQIDKDLDFLFYSFFFFFAAKGQSDGSGEEDVSPVGNASDCGVCLFPNQRGASEGSLQQEIDFPSTNLWSNSSRCHCLSLSFCVCFGSLTRELYANPPRTLLM